MEVNLAASKRLAKGDYGAAEVLVAKGRGVSDFVTEVDGLSKRWKEMRGTKGLAGARAVTPLWRYYQPVLRALVQLGGEAGRADLEPVVEKQMLGTLQPADRALMPRGRERWREMIRRSHKPLVAEGWVVKGPVWRITEAGRKAAEREAGKEEAKV